MNAEKPPSTSIPATRSHLNFVVGRDPEGHWLAVETHGLGGGIFASRDAAVHYAAFEGCCACEAIQVVPTAIELTLHAADRRLAA